MVEDRGRITSRAAVAPDRGRSAHSSSPSGSPFLCPECSKPYQDPRGLGVHRFHAHGVASKNRSTVYNRRRTKGAINVGDQVIALAPSKRRSKADLRKDYPVGHGGPYYHNPASLESERQIDYTASERHRLQGLDRALGEMSREIIALEHRFDHVLAVRKEISRTAIQRLVRQKRLTREALERLTPSGIGPDAPEPTDREDEDGD